MQQAVKKLLIGMFMLVALPVAADLDNSNMAKVVTQYGFPAVCLAPVAVNKIDGQMRVLSAKGFEIEPGIHTINGRATLDITNCPITGGDQQITSAADLEVDFEPGKTYFIGYDHRSAKAEEWTLVVWKVE